MSSATERLDAFLISAFKTRQRSDIPESELLSELRAFNDMVRLAAGDDEPGLKARQSLDDWASEGILRKFYAPRADEPR